MPDFTQTLSKEDLKDYQFVKNRIDELQKTKQNVFDLNLEKLWDEADKAYIPHRLKSRGKRVIATDEEQGWRGTLVELGKTGAWQADFSQPNPFIKMQTASAILIDRNPQAVFNAGSSKYESNTLLMKNLYERNWDTAKSLQQLKLFVMNLMKYGWAIGRTYPRITKRTNRVLATFDPENPEKSKWDTKEVIVYNDVFRKNLDPFNAWIDDMSRPNQPDSTRDWCYREVYPRAIFDEEFGNYSLFEETKEKKGILSARIDQTKNPKEFQDKDLIEVYFYENVVKDLYMVLAGGKDGVPIVIEPLPISDSDGRKFLSCWHTYWLLRHAETPYGIGMYEAMRDDQRVLDRIRNMTIDQLLLSIYKMFFYSGTQGLTETGQITIEPGKGKQVFDPKNVNWLEVPGPGKEAWFGYETAKKDLDDSAGVPPILTGEVIGKTAFEIAQAKEAALKRLKMPLDNISEALEEDAYISISAFQTLYSIPEVYKIADPEKVDRYLKEIKGDQELYDRNEKDEFTAKVYREIQLGLDKDEKGNLIESKESKFFRVKPSGLSWNGIIKVKGQSVLVISKELEKAQDLEFMSVLNPMIHDDPMIVGKSAKELCKLYDKDPDDWLPENFLVEQQPQEQPLFVPSGGESLSPASVTQTPSATSLRATPPNTIQRFMSKLKQSVPFIGGGRR